MKADDNSRSHNLFVDFFESSNIVGVNYDTRFAGSSVWGWRAGLGMSMPVDLFYCERAYSNGISLPVGINGLLGKGSSKFEFGLLVIPELDSFRNTYSIWDEKEGYYKSQKTGGRKWRLGVGIGVDLGYRLQRQNGFFFRVGYSPCVNFSSAGVVVNLLSLFVPYLSFGYTIK